MAKKEITVSEDEVRRMSWKATALMTGILVFGLLAGMFFATVIFSGMITGEQSSCTILEKTMKVYNQCTCTDQTGNIFKWIYLGG